MTTLYELEDVAVAIGGRAILRPLTLALEQARIYGIVGPNGSGKTTLVKLLARQLEPDAGTLRCLGRGMADWGDREFARTIAYMSQFPPAANGLTVRELVSLGRFPWHGALGAFGPDDRQMVASALSQCGVGAFSDRLVDTLSGGERQRVWLAMMIAQGARCLILDEPTSALDLAHQVEMLKLVRELGHSRGVGAVLVLHDVNLAARFCDEILALREGALVARGAPEEIMSPETVSMVYGTAIGMVPHPETGTMIAYPK